MTRGFITIATGKEMYFQFALNLLRSYRLYSADPLPFAIACDQENAYTAQFDRVVRMENAHSSFFDKFELLKTAPFDETIFIDSDCLAYGDLNEYWKYFENADDFSAAGTNYPIDSERGLFQADGIGEYQGRVSWKPDIHGGLYFIRKGPVCDAIYEDCQNIARNYDSYRWPDFCAPYADEPVLCLAMAANGCHAMEADPKNYGIPWEVTNLSCDIFTGKCTYATDWHPQVPHGLMIHWSVRYCKKPLYIFEAEKLSCMVKNGTTPPAPRLNFVQTILYRWKVRYYFLCAKDFTIRAFRKGLRILGLIKE